ncbi:MAG: Holliday junction resolvase RecU [Candidatus Brocadiales bacterium]|nr:Holliday junction resolvase RecU [Candidatus Brocadiales bacterium]
MSQANRGKELEKKINAVNLIYRKKKLAVIHRLELPVILTNKGPVPISTPTDYIGCEGPDGKGVAFDAKETRNTTSFPLANIHDHQLNFLTYYEAVGGKAGFLIWFKEVDDDAFWTPASFIQEFMETETRKSIPYKRFKDEWRVDLTDYLNLLNEDN